MIYIHLHRELVISTLGVWLWIFEIYLVEWVVNDDYSLVGCLVGCVCCLFGGGCEAVLVSALIKYTVY